MNSWTPEQVFLVTYIAAALSGLGELLHSDREVTPRSFLAAILFYGAAGTGLGMLGYEYLGGKTRPWIVISCGLFVGIRAIKLSDIVRLLQKLM
jgi:hypothetical protein